MARRMKDVNHRTRASRVSTILLLVGLVPAPGFGQVPQWFLGERTASIGDQAGEGQELFWVRDATVAPDGRILVLDGGSHSIRVYSGDGVFIRAVGGEGDGPGEYRGPWTFRRLESGDLLIYDRVAQRLTRLDESLDVVGTQPIIYDVGASIPVRGRLRPLESGTVLIAGGDISMMEAARRPAGLHEDDLLVVAYRGGESIPILKRPRGPTFGVRTRQQGLAPPVPFEEALLYAAGRSGLVVGTTHGTTFQLVNEVGEPAAEFTADGSPRAVTPADWDRFQDEFRRTRSTGVTIRGLRTDPGPSVDKFLRTTPRGRAFPLFDAVLVDEQDRLWVREYSLVGDTVTWQIVDVDRGVVGRIALPRDWDLMEAGEAYVLVRERDELDVETVRRYALEH